MQDVDVVSERLMNFETSDQSLNEWFEKQHWNEIE